MIKFIAKKDVWWWRLIGKVFPSAFWLSWTTLGENIYYPPWVEDPYATEHDYTRAHECVHVNDQENSWLPWWVFRYLFLPLPVFFSYYRWKAEREAYLVEINAGACIDDVVETLWGNYLYPWPKRWMKEWFEENARQDSPR